MPRADPPSYDWQIVVKPEAGTTLTDPAAGLLVVGSAYYQVTVLDGTGAPVTNFDPPLQLTVQPNADTLAAAGADPSLVGALDHGSGTFDTQAATVNDDGSLTVSLADLQPAADEGPTRVDASLD
jgi:hypothetical protein